MKYHKPTVVDLGVHVKRANGQVSPTACVSGAAAGAGYQTCGTGTSAAWSCVAGDGVAYGYPSCVPGSTADTYGDCISGSGVYYYCETGSGGTNDPNGCQVGPSFS